MPTEVEFIETSTFYPTHYERQEFTEFIMIVICWQREACIQT